MCIYAGYRYGTDNVPIVLLKTTAENLFLMSRDELLTSLTHKTYFKSIFELTTVLSSLIPLMMITLM